MSRSKVAILVVEDFPDVRQTAVQLLEGLGYQVLDAYNGQAALEILQAHPEIQVLFTDVRMPGMNGLELAEIARRHRPDLKVVLTSGYVGPEDLPGDMPFVPKPWRAQDIAEAVAGAE
ncbi:Blue-light-activated protein [Methylobacterium brachiatum]|nr:Blue-light-activated protein [Methylobacterium brachiatum]